MVCVDPSRCLPTTGIFTGEPGDRRLNRFGSVQHCYDARCAVDLHELSVLKNVGCDLVPTTAGIPNSLATIDACDIDPPMSVTTAAAAPKNSVQPVSVTRATSTSPGTSSSSGERNDPHPADSDPGKGGDSADRPLRANGFR